MPQSMALAPMGTAIATFDDHHWFLLSRMLERIERIERIDRGDADIAALDTNIATALVLHRFQLRAGSWRGYGDLLTPDQIDQLTPASRVGIPEADGITAADAPLTALLAHDGRASWAALAHAAGRSGAYAADRVAALRASGILSFDVDLVTELMGFRTAALLWLTVEPARVASACHVIAAYDEVSFVAAVSGSTNLFVTVVRRNTANLHGHLTGKLAATSGITGIETSPVLRRIKQRTPLSGPRTSG